MYRIDGARLHLPPLRERPDHIPLLVHWIVDRSVEDVEPAYVVQDIMALLRRYRWPGNVRELIHVVKAAIALTETFPRLQPEDLPEEMVQQARTAARAPAPGAEGWVGTPDAAVDLSELLGERSLPQYVRDTTRWLILSALDAHGGVRKDAAAALGITPQNLSNYIKRLQLPRKGARRSG